MEEHSTKYLTITPQNYQGPQKQGMSETLSQPSLKSDITSKCNVVSQIGSWNRKRTLAKHEI